MAENIRARFDGDVTLMAGMLHGHDPAAFVASIRGGVSDVVLVPISFRKGRDPQELFPFFRERIRDVDVQLSITSAIESVWRPDATGPVVVTGSFYLLSDFMNAVKELKLTVAG